MLSLHVPTVDCDRFQLSDKVELLVPGSSWIGHGGIILIFVCPVHPELGMGNYFNFRMPGSSELGMGELS
jgi:hypothetical protein